MKVGDTIAEAAASFLSALSAARMTFLAPGDVTALEPS